MLSLGNENIFPFIQFIFRARFDPHGNESAFRETQCTGTYSVRFNF